MRPAAVLGHADVVAIGVEQERAVGPLDLELDGDLGELVVAGAGDGDAHLVVGRIALGPCRPRSRKGDPARPGPRSERHVEPSGPARGGTNHNEAPARPVPRAAQSRPAMTGEAPSASQHRLDGPAGGDHQGRVKTPASPRRSPRRACPAVRQAGRRGGPRARPRPRQKSRPLRRSPGPALSLLVLPRTAPPSPIRSRSTSAPTSHVAIQAPIDCRAISSGRPTPGAAIGPTSRMTSSMGGRSIRTSNAPRAAVALDDQGGGQRGIDRLGDLNRDGHVGLLDRHERDAGELGGSLIQDVVAGSTQAVERSRR